MPSPGPLPKFRHPPLIEVVHGVQFRGLPLTIAHPGLFYATIKDRFPVVRSAPALPPDREDLEGANALPTMRFQMMDGAEMPRAWYVSADEVLLAQMQSNRLHLNWRRQDLEGGPAKYPHFDRVSACFAELYTSFNDFADAEELGTIHPEQCELTYINHIEPVDDARSVRPERVLRVWHNPENLDWDVPPSDINLGIRFLIRNGEGTPVARMHVTATPLRRIGSDVELMQLEITARGVPLGGGEKGVRAFHAFAHEHIVRCFAGLTTPEAHEIWGRYQ